MPFDAGQDATLGFCWVKFARREEAERARQATQGLALCEGHTLQTSLFIYHPPRPPLPSLPPLPLRVSSLHPPLLTRDRVGEEVFKQGDVARYIGGFL